MQYFVTIQLLMYVTEILSRYSLHRAGDVIYIYDSTRRPIPIMQVESQQLRELKAYFVNK